MIRALYGFSTGYREGEAPFDILVRGVFGALTSSPWQATYVSVG